jgi:hypothetical protein
MTPATVLVAMLEVMAETCSTDMPRCETIAQATYDVAETQPFRDGPEALAAGLVTLVRLESNGAESVHTGDVRGPSGELCLVQIHPSVPGYGPELVGTGYDATRRCLALGAKLLAGSLSRCVRQRYVTYRYEAMFSAYHLGGKCWASKHRMRRGAMLRKLLRGAK